MYSWTNLVMASMNVDMDLHVMNNDDEYADGNQQSLSSKGKLFNNDSSIESQYSKCYCNDPVQQEVQDVEMLLFTPTVCTCCHSKVVSHHYVKFYESNCNYLHEVVQQALSYIYLDIQVIL